MLKDLSLEMHQTMFQKVCYKYIRGCVVVIKYVQIHWRHYEYECSIEVQDSTESTARK